MNDKTLSIGDLVRIVDYHVGEDVFEISLGKFGLILGALAERNEPIYQVLVDDRSFYFYEDMLEKA